MAPNGSQSSGRPSAARTRSGAKIVDPIQQLPTPADRERDEQTLHRGAHRDGEHGVLGGGAPRIGVGWRPIGNHERDDQLGCVVENLAAVDAAFDGVGVTAVAAEIGAPPVLHRIEQPEPYARVLHPDEPHRPGVVRCRCGERLGDRGLDQVGVRRVRR